MHRSFSQGGYFVRNNSCKGSRFFQAQKFWDNYEGGLSYFGEELWGDGGWYMNK